jgi:diacylglycerol kinase (ATP)
MRTPPSCAILNPHAGSANRVDEVRKRLEDSGYEVRMTVGPGDATELARERAAAGVPIVVACGGDGTISEVARGLIPARGDTRLGVIPLGTGNDLARTLAVPTELDAALEILRSGRERALDVIAVDPDDAERTYAVNVAAGGFSGQVDEVLSSELKSRWGPLAYVWSAARVFPNLTDYSTTLSFDDGPPERIEALNVIVANARTCGGGFQVAPFADPEDGLLDVVVVRWASALDLARVGMRLMRGDYLDAEGVMHRRARSVRVVAKPAMWFNVDGELFSRAAVTFRVVPRALRVLVGAEYRNA